MKSLGHFVDGEHAPKYYCRKNHGFDKVIV